MFAPKLCPHCNGILQFQDAPAAGGRFILTELLFWAALALLFTHLGAPPETRELYAFLAGAAGIAWGFLRGGQQAAGREVLERRLYRCANCRHRFAGESLREIRSA